MVHITEIYQKYLPQINRFRFQRAANKSDAVFFLSRAWYRMCQNSLNVKLRAVLL